MSYKQTLVKILPEYIKPKVLKRNNKYKKWKYGYDKEHDVIVISKTGEIGDVYEIQNLKIALPKQNNIHTFKNNKWSRLEYPKDLDKIKSVFEWNQKPEYFKELWYDYIDSEFHKKRTRVLVL